jgi:hypothetical protein
MGTGPSGARAGDYAGFDEAIRNFECNGGSLGTVVILNAFDLVELDGQEWRLRSLEERKERLGRLLVKAPGGGPLTEHLEGDGPAKPAIFPFIERPQWIAPGCRPDEEHFRFWPKTSVRCSAAIRQLSENKRTSHEPSRVDL